MCQCEIKSFLKKERDRKERKSTNQGKRRMQCKRGRRGRVGKGRQDKWGKNGRNRVYEIFISYAEYISHNIDTEAKTFVGYKVLSLFRFELSFSHTKTNC